MFRSTGSLVRNLRPASFTKTTAGPITRSIQIHNPRPLIPFQQTIRFASSGGPKRDVAHEKLKSDPSKVSTNSSTHWAFDKTRAVTGSSDPDVKEELKHDIGLVKETFRLSKIPYESHVAGLAGTVPYFATSLSTIYLAWDLTKTFPTGSAFYDAIFMNHENAQYYLGILEPLQLGYGAIILSFLGAIHWGLEYAEKTSNHARTRFRYGMGIIASAAAWPTVLLPIEYGLISQFGMFVALYVADSRATTWGWAPAWYGQYRFMLTAMVGLAIFISLVGRSEIEKSERLSKEYMRANMTRPGIADTETDWVKVEAEDKKKIKEEEEAEKKKEQQKQSKDKKDGKQKDKQDDKQKDKQDDKQKDKKDDQNEKSEDGKDDAEKKAGQAEDSNQGKGDAKKAASKEDKDGKEA